MKNAVILALVISAVALGACRRETPYEPMKLGVNTTSAPDAR
jgi:hypothetical protein